MRAHLEREIRLLPQVLACTIRQDEVVVLVPPAADQDEARKAIATLLGEKAGSLRISVVGGTRVVSAPAGRVASVTRSPAVLVGAVVLTAALASASFAAGLVRREAPAQSLVRDRPPAASQHPDVAPTRAFPTPETSVSEPPAGPTTGPPEQEGTPSPGSPQVLGQQVIRASASPSTNR